MFFRITPKKIKKWESKKNINNLSKALKDNRTDIRLSAIVSLSKICDPQEAVIYLVNMLNDEDSKVKMSAIAALVEIGEQGIEYLIDSLQKKEIRSSVQEVLLKIGNPSINPILDVITSKNKHYLRKDLYMIIKELGVDEIPMPDLPEQISDKNNLQIAFDQIEILNDCEAYEKVIKIYDRILNEYPRFAINEFDIRRDRAIAYCHVERYEEAERELSEVISTVEESIIRQGFGAMLGNKKSNSHYWLLVARFKGNTDKAMNEFMRL